MKRRRDSSDSPPILRPSDRLKLNIPPQSHVSICDESCRYSYAPSSIMTDRSPDRATFDRSMGSSPTSPRIHPFGVPQKLGVFGVPAVPAALSDQTSQNSTTASVHDRFAALRDAIYFSHKDPGFILSADEKFVYPAGATWNRAAEPVEIDDVETYFKGWDLWTPDFSRRLEFREYPVIKLSRLRPKGGLLERFGWLQPNGKKVVYEARGELLHDPITIEYLGSVTWVAELGDPEELQRREREQVLLSFETICDSLPHQVFTTDSNVQAQWFSRPFYEFTGLDREQALGRRWESVVHPDDLKSMCDTLGGMAETGNDIDVHFRFKRHDGVYRWFSGKTHAVKDQHGNILRWYGTNTDIHDTVVAREAASKLERENARLSHLEQTAKESNRLKSQFLANMSHELRTPIAGILGMVQLLADTKLNAEQKDFVSCINTSAGNLLTIVNDILDVSKIESGRLQVEEIPFKPWPIIDDIERVWTHIAREKGLWFSVRCPDHLRDVKLIGDPTRVGQILSNLISNALKFTSKGSVALEVSMTDNDAFSTLSIAVEDTGIGIEKQVLDTLFTPFRQGDSSTARVYGGSGLGLSISRSLAQLMGGTLELDSTPSIGTRAILKLNFKRAPADAVIIKDFESSIPNFKPHQELGAYLPYTVDDPATPDTGISTPSAPEDNIVPAPAPRNHITVLIVEDNPINLKIAVKAVQKMGFSTATACNGQEALDYLARPDHKADVILLDVMMPIVDGYEATRRLRTTEPYVSRKSNSVLYEGSHGPEKCRLSDLPIIALTANAIPGERENCLEIGFDDYMTKPLNAPELEKKLVKWCSTGRPKARPPVRRTSTV